MDQASDTGGAGSVRRSLWQLGRAELDDGPLTLKLDGQAVELDRKTTEVLHQLLLHAGEVVTKDEIFDTVWARAQGNITDGVLTNAISRLRKLLGDDGQTLIVTHPKVGYRYAGPVSRKVIDGAVESLSLKAEDPVPSREHWRLSKPLGKGGQGEVWLAEHKKTREQRVFKFAIDATRLTSLKREATLYRLLREVLGERPDFARVLEWNFEQSPFFLECEFGGVALQEWAAAQGGLSAVPHPERLRLLTETAEAVAAAHSAGVLHKDLKPGNVLIYTGADGKPHPRLTDFGSSRLADASQLDALGITRLGFTVTQLESSGGNSGTPLYLAPELMAGQLPTVQSDVYALGVMLYQLVVGDFNKPLVAGWEQDVEDELLREDIAAAANGSAIKRLSAARELAARLAALDARRRTRQEKTAQQQEMQRVRETLNRNRARRPWLVATAVALLIGSMVSTGLFYQARASQQRAEREAEVASAVQDFMAKDVVAAANPQYSSTPKVSLIDALKIAGAQLDTRFANQPEVAANLRVKIGEALASLNDDPARALADLKRGCDWMSAHYEARDPRRIDCLLSLAGAEVSAGDYDAAKRVLTPLKLALQDPQAKPEDLLRASLLEARVVMATDSNEQGRQLVDEALRVAVERKTDPKAVLEARILMAKSFVAAWRYDEFLKEFAVLLSQAQGLMGEDSIPFLEVKLEYAKKMTNNQDLLEAEPIYAELLPVLEKQLGAESGLYLDALSWNAFNTDRMSYYQRQNDVEISTADLKVLEDRNDLWHPRLIAAQKARFGADSEAYLQALFDAGRAQWHRKNQPAAIAQFKQLIPLAQRFTNAGRRDHWVNRLRSCITSAYLDINQPREAEPFMLAMDITASKKISGPLWDATQQFDRGRYYQQMGDYPRAVETYLHILTTTSDQPQYWIGSYFRNINREHKKLPSAERKQVYDAMLALEKKHGSPPPEEREF